MTNKEMKELIQKQSKQISELISLVQELEKKDRPFPSYIPWRITEPWNHAPWDKPNTPNNPINPWVTYCGTGTGNYTSSSSTEPKKKNTFEGIV